MKKSISPLSLDKIGFNRVKAHIEKPRTGLFACRKAVNNITAGYAAFQELAIELMRKFSAAAVAVYLSGSASPLRGEALESMFALERYFAFGATTVIENADGVEKGKYKSRYVTRYRESDTEILIVVSSYALEAFRGEKAESMTAYIYGFLSGEEKS